MKKILSHFYQNTLLSLTIMGCMSMYPATLMPPVSTFANASSETIASENSQPENSDIANSPDFKDNPEGNSDDKPPESNDDTLNDPPSDSEKDPDDPPSPDLPEEKFDFDTDLIIYAVNPGYTQTTSSGKLSDVGEFIELLNLTDAPLALAGYSIVYTNGSGNETSLFTFPDESYLAGKHLLLRYHKSPEADAADLTYRSSLALKAGPLKLVYDGEAVDEVCWTGKASCESSFSSKSPSVLKRDLATGSFAHLVADEYLPEFSSDEARLILPPDSDDETDPDLEPENQIPPHCQELEFSELLTYYVDDKSEQFIELFNPTNSAINLSGCKISFKNKMYDLNGTVEAGKYFAYYQSNQFALTKNPKNPLVLALIDADDSVVDEISYPNGQKKSTSYAKIIDTQGNESWQLTYAPTPNAENVYQKFRTCEAGKIINEATGNCVKVTALKSSTSTSSSKTSILAPCPAGKYRNPLTGRCKKIETASSTTKECAEGYERNPATNRCRKIKSPNDGADYALVPTTHSDQTVFIGIGIVALIVSLGLIYIILQFRHEIARATRKACQRLNHIRQDLLARTIGRHRNKKP